MPAKSTSKTSPSAKRKRTKDSVIHLHVVIDPDLHKGVEAHAAKLNRPQSAAVRDLLRLALGLPRHEHAPTT